MSNRDILQTLKSAPLRNHLVNFYDNSTELAKRVADFAEPGLRNGEAVLWIAIPEHLHLFRTTLKDRGLNTDMLAQTGQLKCLDADMVLKQFMVKGEPYWVPFEAAIGSLISALSGKYGKVRAYGEMVNVLWHKGQMQAALKLEEFWNQLSMIHPFCLFCAYAMDIFNPALYPEAISTICHAHSHSFADSVDGAFEAVIQRAVEEIVEPRALIPLQSVLNNHDTSATKLSPSLQAFLWLNREMPQVAEQVLSRARTLYQSRQN